MAEAVGLTASIIGIGELAAQAAKLVLKLKNIWDQVKEAPDDINYMMLELKILVSSLETIENQHNDVELPPYVFDTSDMRQSLELCQHAAKQLSDLVTELALQTDANSQFKRKMGAAKFIMKKDQIQKVKSRLGSSISLLKLCRETYTSTIQPHVVVYRLYKILPSSQIIEKPHSLPSTSGQTSSITDPSPSVPSSSSLLNKCMIRHNRKTSRIESSLWVCGSKLLGIVEYETKRVPLTTAQGDQEEIHDDSVPYSISRRSARLRVRPPTWLLSKSWEALHHNLYGEWKFVFRTYNIVPVDAPVLKYIEEGNLSALQDLFARKQATPFDRLELCNYGLLRHGIARSTPEVCHFLMDLTKQPVDLEEVSDLFWMFAMWGTKVASLEYENLSRRLVAYINTNQDIELDPRHSIPLVSIFYGDSVALNAFILQFAPTYWKEPQRIRTISALRYAKGQGIYNPDMVWKLLGLKDEVMDLEIAQTRFCVYGTLLHRCCMNLVEIVLDIAIFHGLHHLDSYTPFFPWQSIMPRFPPGTMVPFYREWASGPYHHWTSLKPALLSKSSHVHWNNRYFPKSYISELCDNWCVLMKHLLDSGASVHLKDINGRTPLLFAINELLNHSSIHLYHLSSSGMEAAANTVLRIWLEALSAVGVDIQKYGAVEQYLYSTEKVNKKIQIYECFCNLENGVMKKIRRRWEWRIISLECGPSIEDWRIHGSEPTDEYAGQFWTMIDHPEWKLPGAWIGEEEESEDEWYEDTDDESSSGGIESEHESD